jgi:hypothetical protein
LSELAGIEPLLPLRALVLVKKLAEKFLWQMQDRHDSLITDVAFDLPGSPVWFSGRGRISKSYGTIRRRRRNMERTE